MSFCSSVKTKKTMSFCSYVKIKRIMSKRSSLLRVGEQLVLKTKEQKNRFLRTKICLYVLVSKTKRIMSFCSYVKTKNYV